MDELRVKPQPVANGEPVGRARARRVPRARAPDDGTAADGARGGRAALRLRPPLCPDRRRARIVRGRCTRRSLLRGPQTEEERMSITPELDAQFRAAAVREGLVDVRYDVVESPFGELLVAATDRGLCRIWFHPEGQEEELARLFGAPRPALAARRRAARARRVLRGRAPRVRPAARSPRRCRSTSRYCSSWRRFRTGSRRRTARWRARSDDRAPRAPSARS